MNCQFEYRHVRLHALVGFLILFIILMCTGRSVAQSSGQVINECSDQIVDQQGYDQVDEQVCIYGNPDQLNASVSMNNDDGDYMYIPGLGAQIQLITNSDVNNIFYLYQDQLGTSQFSVNYGFIPVPGSTYQLVGYASDCVDPTGNEDTTNCYWNYDIASSSITADYSTPPAGLVALTATPGNGQVTLSWGSVSGATGYDIYLGAGSSGSEWSGGVYSQVDENTTSQTFTGLTNNTPYYFVVMASDDSGDFAGSYEISATPAFPQGTPTTTSVALSPTTSVSGAQVNATVAVTPSSANGTVSCFEGGTQVGSTATVSSGSATIGILGLAVGNDAITCQFAGNSPWLPSSGSATETVAYPTMTVGVTSSANPSPVGSATTFNISVTASDQSVPTGTVDLLNGGTTIGTAPLQSGAAAITISNLMPGTNSITASYDGDATHPATTSATPLAQDTTVPSPTWTESGTMTPGLYYQTATLLNDGTVLIAGGDNGANGDEGAVNTAEIYTPGSGFATTGSMYAARFGHTASLLPDGMVLIAGGENHPSPTMAATEIYNPEAGAHTFSPGPNLNIPRSQHTATTLNDGTILIAGGYTAGVGTGTSDVGQAEIYTPSATGGSFSEVGIGSLGTPRTEHTATLLQDGTVLIVGGRDNSGEVTGSAEIYTPSTRQFTSTGSLITARCFHTATLLPNGDVLIAGGSDTDGNPIQSAELYTPSATGGSFSAAGSLNTARYGQSAALLTNGNVLLFGGVISSAYQSEVATPTSELYIYSTSGGTFSNTSSLNTARYYATATLLSDGTVLTTGGSANNFVPIASAEIYAGGNTFTGVINPKYLVIGVTYAPPGPSSYVSYQNSVYVGSTTTVTNSFSGGSSMMVSVASNAGVSGWLHGSVTGTSTSSFTQLNSHTGTVTATGQTSTNWKTAGTPNSFAPVNSNYDTIWIWLNPLLVFTVDANAPDALPVWNGYGYNVDDYYDNGLNDGTQGMDIWPVQVGCLNGVFLSDPTMVAACQEDFTKLSRTWASNEYFPNGDVPALTQHDYNQILTFDPFASPSSGSPSDYSIVLNSSYPATTLDGRYTQTTTVPQPPATTAGSLENIPYAIAGPGQPPPSGTFTTTYSNSTIDANTAMNTTTQSFSLEEQFNGGFFGASVTYKISETGTLTWVNTTTTSLTNTKTQTDTAYIQGPPCNAPYCTPSYSGLVSLGQPSNFNIFQDNLFGTFMFSGAN